MSKNTHIIEVKTKGAKKSEKQIKGVNSGLKNMAKSAGVAAAAYFGSQALLGAIKSSIDLFTKQEEAEKKLRFQAGEMTDSLIKQAEALQKNTRFGDEVIIAQQAYLASLGLTQTQIEDTIEASLDLAAATGMTLESAVLNTSKTLSGMAGELGEKLGPAFRELDADALKAGEGIKFIAEQFGGSAQADAESFGGALEQMRNSVGDAAEAFGSLLAPAIRVVADTVKFLAEGFTAIINLEATTSKMLADSAVQWGDNKKALHEYDEAVGRMSFDELLNEYFMLNNVTDESTQLIIREKAMRGELGATIDLVKNSTEGLTFVFDTNQEIQENGLTQNEMLIEQNERIIADIDRKSEAVLAESEILDSYTATRMLQMEKEQAAIELEDRFILQMREKGEMMDVLTSKEKAAMKLQDEKMNKDKQEQASQKEKIDKTLQGIAKLSGSTKASSIADAISATYSGANEEYRKYVKQYPAPLGTILGIAAAGATIGRGLQNVKEIKKAQYGADFITDSPQLMMVGEGSGPERVQVTPLADPNIDGPQGQGITLNISGNVLHESFIEDSVIPQIREGLRLGENMGI